MLSLFQYACKKNMDNWTFKSLNKGKINIRTALLASNPIKGYEFGKRMIMHRVFRSTAASVLACLGALMIFSTILTGCKFQPGWGYNKGYAPEQPIPFDHSLHVGTNKIQCQYCHNQVERTKHSNIPALSTCMNCHLQVATDKPAIQKLREAYDSGGSVEWVRVHMLPDFVHFNHNAHLSLIHI